MSETVDLVLEFAGEKIGVAMGLNLSNRQIAAELAVILKYGNENSIRPYLITGTTILRNGIVAQEPQVQLEGTVECDEVSIVVGHKGHPETVKKKGRKARKRRLKGPRGRGTATTDKPPPRNGPAA